MFYFYITFEQMHHLCNAYFKQSEHWQQRLSCGKKEKLRYNVNPFFICENIYIYEVHSEAYLFI